MQIFGSGGSGLRLLADETLSAASALDITGLDADGFYFMRYRLVPGTTNSALNMRWSEDGGASFGSANYGNWIFGAAGSLAATNAATAIALSDGIGTSSGGRCSGVCHIHPQDPGGFYQRSVTFQNYQTDSSGNYRGSSGAGTSQASSANALTAFRLLMSSGTMSGIVKLWKVLP
jgi:hypothetical protein